MSEPTRQGRVLPIDPVAGDDANPVAMEPPVSQDEIEDLLYDESRSAAERRARLLDIRAQCEGLPATDAGTDMEAMVTAIDTAIASLDEAAAAGGREAATYLDPADHLEALAPDDEDAIDRLLGDDEDGTEPR